MTSGHEFDDRIMEQTSHRPWPIREDARWAMTQSWHDLLFAHWRVDPRQLRTLVPAQFELDLFDGTSWVGIVPFHMTNVAPRGVPALPWVSAFPELNVRTYVRVDDRPGIYFFSLDAGSAAAVLAAYTILNLPYHHAQMTVSHAGEAITYRSIRYSNPDAAFDATYEPVGSAFEPRPGSLEHFLTERYCLYHLDHHAKAYRLDIHHPPWRLQPARATFVRNTMTDINGIALPLTPPLLHFTSRQDMVAWLPIAV
jgi:uncharacterized protein